MNYTKQKVFCQSYILDALRLIIGELFIPRKIDLHIPHLGHTAPIRPNLHNGKRDNPPRLPATGSRSVRNALQPPPCMTLKDETAECKEASHGKCAEHTKKNVRADIVPLNLFHSSIPFLLIVPCYHINTKMSTQFFVLFRRNTSKYS